MSLPLIDPDLIKCSRTNAAIAAAAISRGMTHEGVIQEVMAEWAEARIAASEILLKVLANTAGDKEKPLPLERQIEDDLCAALRGAGIAFTRQVKTTSGIADVVLDDVVIEVKRAINTPAALAKAHGQALMYARLLGKAKTVVLAAVVSSKTTDPNIHLVCGADGIRRFVCEVAHD